MGNTDLQAPVVVLGAPRSGTKLIREALKLDPAFSGLEHELEAVWSLDRKENWARRIVPEELRDEDIRWIRDRIHRFAAKHPHTRFVEKTVANTLRVELVRAVLPDSPIVHVVRDGRDAALSIRQRSQQPLDLKYIIRNRVFPVREIPRFLKRQLNFLLGRAGVGGKRWWGPRFDDSEDLLERLTPLELAATQWQRCAESALDGLAHIPRDRVLQVRYEDFVRNPQQELRQLIEFLGSTPAPLTLEKVSGYVQPSSIGKWQRDLTAEEQALLRRMLHPTLERLGYHEH